MSHPNSDSVDPQKLERFVQHMLQSQHRLYGFIRALVPDANLAQDVLQETNLVMWRKCDEFAPGTDFHAWACRIAHFQVLAHRRDKGRDRHLFDEELLRRLAPVAEQQTADLQLREQALRDCLQQVTAERQELLRLRYGNSLSINEIADRLGQSVSAVTNSLYRVRRALLECTRRRLSAEERV